MNSCYMDMSPLPLYILVGQGEIKPDSNVSRGK